jgi:hypothetical protein
VKEDEALIQAGFGVSKEDHIPLFDIRKLGGIENQQYELRGSG